MNKLNYTIKEPLITSHRNWDFSTRDILCRADIFDAKVYNFEDRGVSILADNIESVYKLIKTHGLTNSYDEKRLIEIANEIEEYRNKIEDLEDEKHDIEFENDILIQDIKMLLTSCELQNTFNF